MGQKSAKAIVGEGRCCQRCNNWKQARESPGSLTPPKGRTKKRNGDPMSLPDITNPNGGIPGQRVIDQLPPEQHLLELILSPENMELAWKRGEGDALHISIFCKCVKMKGVKIPCVFR